MVHDQYVEGAIPLVIEQVRLSLPPLFRTLTRLGPSGRFERIVEYQEAAWLETVINALTHRSYAL